MPGNLGNSKYFTTKKTLKTKKTKQYSSSKHVIECCIVSIMWGNSSRPCTGLAFVYEDN